MTTPSTPTGVNLVKMTTGTSSDVNFVKMTKLSFPEFKCSRVSIPYFADNPSKRIAFWLVHRRPEYKIRPFRLSAVILAKHRKKKIYRSVTRNVSSTDFYRGQFWPLGIVVAHVGILVCVRVCVNPEIVRAFTHHLFMPEPPNSDKIHKTPWLKFPANYMLLDVMVLRRSRPPPAMVLTR